LKEDNVNDALTTKQSEASAIALLNLVAQAEDYLKDSRAANTIRSYKSDWHDLVSLPAQPATVALYLTEKTATLKPSTLQRRVVAISQAHKGAGCDPPTAAPEVRRLLRGICRKKGTAQDSKAATVTEDIRAMVDVLPSTLLGVRDRALLLVGYAGAFRRSELVSLDIRDITMKREGLIINLRRSKTDQGGAGEQIGVAYGTDVRTCPVRSLEDWLTRAGVTEGPVFRSVDRHGNLSPRRLTSEVVAMVVKRTLDRLGRDSSLYGGHSLRSGFATEAALASVPERVIAKQTRHRSMQILRRYIKDGSLWQENPSMKLGL
jgi:integrase